MYFDGSSDNGFSQSTCPLIERVHRAKLTGSLR
jgi:hypothetical protein